MDINIFATSDIHGYICGYDYSNDVFCENSLAAIYTAYKNSNEENKILVDNGDMIQGNFIDYFTKEKIHPAIEIMNMMDYSVWNLGNHEFNFGLENIKKIIGQFKNTAIMANSNDKFFEPFSIVEKSGIKIAFIGINTILTNDFETENSMDNLEILNPVPVIDNILENLRGKVNAIVGLFHLGMKDENAVFGSGMISIIDNLKNADMIDAIVLGHTHKRIEEQFYKDILITQPFVHANCVNKITLTFDNGKLIDKKAVSINSEDFEPDTEIISYFKKYHEKILQNTHKIIGYIRNSDESVNADLENGPVANFISDIMLNYSDADVTAFHIDNSSAVLKNGPLRRCDMANIYQYAGGEVSEYMIKGSDLKKYMEWSAAYFEKEGNKIFVNEKRAKFKYKTYDIFGNIHYKLNLSNEKGSRVEDLRYNDGRKIKPDDNLKIAMNEYRMDFLTSDKGPLYNRSFEKIRTSKYQDEYGFKQGTISGELVEKFFVNLKDHTYFADNKKYFEIK